MCRQSQSAGTRDDGMDGDITQLFMGVLYQCTQGSLDVRMMPAVIGKHDLIRRVQNGNFDGRGSDIYSKCEIFCNQR